MVKPKWTPEKNRRALKLKKEGFSDKHIGKSLGFTESAISAQICRLRKLLAERFCGSFWKEDQQRTDLLIEIWNSGKSATFIASVTFKGKISSSSICSKVDRLRKSGIDLRSHPVKDARTSTAQHKTTEKTLKPKKCAPYRDPISTVIPLCVPLVNLEFTQCHYPVDGPIYCGHPRVQGSRWCEGHQKECTRPR